MSNRDDAPNIAIFCDFENVAIGVRDAKYNDFDIHLILERLLDKGKIVVKKAYADWERYKSAKRPMHEAAFELIEIPHVSYSGKNSADIRMVVDALDLCYTKSHVDMFVIISGDSDFSPLVSKLRENDKKVIGLGVKKASSDLLIGNCDEFIYYDDLVRDKRTQATPVERGKGGRRGESGRGRRGKGEGREAKGEKAAEAKATEKPELKPRAVDPSQGDLLAQVEPPTPSATAIAAAPAAVPGGEAPTEEQTQADVTGSKEEAIEMVLETVEALFREREDNLWGSMVKQTLKRKRPNFLETFYGYRTFNQLLEDAQSQGLLELQKDEKSGGYLITSFGPNA
jgi:uncharacterized protein (TIGR00288 family)